MMVVYLMLCLLHGNTCTPLNQMTSMGECLEVVNIAAQNSGAINGNQARFYCSDVQLTQRPLVFLDATEVGPQPPRATGIVGVDPAIVTSVRDGDGYLAGKVSLVKMRDMPEVAVMGTAKTVLNRLRLTPASSATPQTNIIGGRGGDGTPGSPGGKGGDVEVILAPNTCVNCSSAGASK